MCGCKEVYRYVKMMNRIGRERGCSGMTRARRLKILTEAVRAFAQIIAGGI
jgi:hypothetical protein